jgi:hypothetical protein
MVGDEYASVQTAVFFLSSSRTSVSISDIHSKLKSVCQKSPNDWKLEFILSVYEYNEDKIAVVPLLN